MRAVLTALAVVGFATSALADIHPMYHERNKAAAASVAVVDVTSITPALRPDHMGECTIAARVTAVERGDHLAVGQRLALTVTCFVLWVAYGVLTQAWPVIVANACALVMAFGVLMMKWRFR